MRHLTPGERAAFRLTHDLSDRDGYAVDLLTLCGWQDAQQFWDEAPAGRAYEALSQCEDELARDTIAEHVNALVEDPFLTSVMRVCEHYRVSLTEFTAWPARDQNLALAYYLESRDTCPGCGLAKRLRKQFVQLSSESCVHCQQMSEARKSIPDTVRDFTHITILPETP